MRCNKCGKEVHSDSVFCSSCGEKITRRQNKKRWVIPLSIVMGVALVGTAVFAGFHFAGKNNNQNISSKTKTKDTDNENSKSQKQEFKEVDGRIEVYLPTSIKASYGETDGNNQYFKQSLTYNEKGLLVAYTRQDGTTISNKEQMSYSPEYYILKHISDENYGEARPNSITDYKYDEKNNLTSYLTTGNSSFDGEYTISIIMDTEIKRPISGIEQNNDGTQTYNFIYEYNDSGNITHWDDGNSLQPTNWYASYNEDGRVSNVKEINSRRGNSETIFSYDEKGRVISKQSKKDTQEDYNTALFQYNVDGKPTMHGNFNEFENIEYEYEEGLIKKAATLDNKYLLEYDERGNIIKYSVKNEKNSDDEKVEIKYEKYYIDKEYWEFYYNSYYYIYRTAIFADHHQLLPVPMINDNKCQEAIFYSSVQSRDNPFGGSMMRFRDTYSILPIMDNTFLK